MMNRTLFNVLLVTAGAAIGSVVTWKVVTTKYEKLIQEEIDSVKEEYKNLYANIKAFGDMEFDEDDSDYVNEEDSNDEEDVFEPALDSEVFEYHNISSRYRSSTDMEEDDNEEEGGTGETDEAPYINGPYVISPDDFRCSPPGYNAQALDYFSDGVLADSWGAKMDIETTIGEDSLEHFGDYADDILYVRNERLEVDYEITRDPRTYDETVRTNPNPYYGT